MMKNLEYKLKGQVTNENYYVLSSAPLTLFYVVRNLQRIENFVILMVTIK